MIVSIQPSFVGGEVVVPASKSMGHRALLCASLAAGTSVVTGLSMSKDIEATMRCLQALGARFQERGDQWIVEGCDPKARTSPAKLDAGESGSTLRFLVPVAALGSGPARFLGQGRLLSRPMTVYETLFSSHGLRFVHDQEQILVQGPLPGGNYRVPGNVSSQFGSGLLFALPLADANSVITIDGKFESKSYVDLTLKALAQAGIAIREEKGAYRLAGAQSYRPGRFHVEKDYSQAAFFAVLAALNAPLVLRDMDLESRQGDKAILSLVQKAGAQVDVEADRIHIRPGQRRGQTIDLADCPDLGPILCVLAAFIPETTTIRNAGRLRMKESDRIEAMETELRKWGVDITSDEDTITICGQCHYVADHEIVMDGHNDHRVVMACTVFGLCAGSPSKITGAQAVAKSYPTFFQDIQKIGGKVEWK